MNSLSQRTFDRGDVLMSAGCSIFFSAAVILLIPRFGIAILEILAGLLLMGCAFAARARLRREAHKQPRTEATGRRVKWLDRYDLAMILTIIMVQAVAAGSLRRFGWSEGTIRMFPLVLLAGGILLKPRLLRATERRAPRKEEVDPGTHAGDGPRRDFDEKGVQ